MTAPPSAAAPVSRASQRVAELRVGHLDVRQVRAFLHVAEDLHFGRAAARLFIAQPALSRIIRTLEADVGVPLLERSTRRVRLTPAGEAFAAECRLALAHLGRAVNAAQAAAEGGEGRLRVGYMDFAINGRLPQLLQAFRARHPRVNLDLQYMPTALQHVALLQGRIDVGFVIGEFVSPKVANLLVDRDDFVALLPDGHRLATRRQLSIGELAAEPFVVGSDDAFSSFRPLMLSICHAAGYVPRIVQQASSTTGILGMVAAGVGVTIFSGCVRNLRRSGVVLRPLVDVPETIATYACWVEERPSPMLSRFLELLGTAVPGR